MKALAFAMALQFEADGQGGYLYRKDQTGPALPASAAERDRHVARFGWLMLFAPVLYLLEVILLALIMQGILERAPSMPIVLFMAGAAFGSLYLLIRWLSHAPARAFAGRSPVASAIPRARKFGRVMARMTYMKILLTFGGMAVLFWLVSPDHPDRLLVSLAIPGAVGLGFALWKWRVEADLG